MLEVDDRVRYSDNFLQSITGPLAHVQGVIQSIRKIGKLRICSVRWDDNITSSSLDSNLQKVLSKMETK